MATFTYNQILRAVERAERAAETYINVASIQQDFTQAEFEAIKTLKRRIDDHLEIELEDIRGVDGISVSSIVMDETTNDITVTYSDNTTQVFTDLGITSIDSYDIVNDELIENFDDTTSINHGQIVGDPGNLIASAEVQDDGTIIFTSADGGTYSIGNINNFGDNPITAVRQEDGELFVQLNGVWQPDTVGVVAGDRGEDGSLPVEKDANSILISWDGVEQKVTLTIERTNGSPIILDNVPFDVVVAAPEDVLALDKTSNNHNVFTVFTLITNQQINLGNFNGVDGTNGDDGVDANVTWGETVGGYDRLKWKDADFSLGNGYPVLRVVDPQSSAIKSLAGTYVDVYADDVTISSASIDSNGDAVVVLAYTDQDNNPITSSFNLGGVLGGDGETLESISIDPTTGDVEVVYAKAGTSIIGNLKYNIITEAAIDPLADKIKLTFEDGDFIETTSTEVNGSDGLARFIQRIVIDSANEGMLSFVMNTGTDIVDIGKLNPLRNHSVGVSLAGELSIKLAGDVSPVVMGNIRGTDSSRDITDVLFDGNVFQLQVNGTINEAIAGQLFDITAVEYSHTTGEISFTRNGIPYSIPYTRQPDGDHGVWIEADGWGSVADVEGYRSLSITTTDSVNHVSSLLIDADYINTITKAGEDINYSTSSPTGGKITSGIAGTIPGLDAEDGVYPEIIQIEGLDLWFRDWNDTTTADVNVGQILSRWVDELYLDANGDQVFYKYNTDDTATALELYLRGQDAVYPVSIAIDANRKLVATYNNSDVEIIGDADGADAQYITGFTRVGDVFTIEYNDTTTQDVTIEGFDGQLPTWITEFAITPERQFAVRYAQTDYDLIESEDVTLTTIDAADGLDAEYIKSISRVGDDFSATKNDDSVISIGSFEGFDGVDAKWVVDIQRVDDNFTVEYNTGDTVPLVVTDFDGDDGQFISNITIDANRHLIIEWHDNDLPSEDLGYIDFDEGVTDVYLDGQGFLVIEHKVAPTVTSSRPLITTVSDAYITNDELFIETNDSLPINVGNVAGTDVGDGVYITNIAVENARLIATLSDTTTIDAGDFIRREIADFVLTGGLTNELVVQYNDSTEDNLGNIRGESATISIISAFINQDYELVLTLDDPSSIESLDPIVIPGVRGVDGNGIASANIVSGELIFTLDDTTTINVGNIQVDFGFAPYNPARVYNTAETMTLDGAIWAATRDGVEVTPDQDAGAWSSVRLEGDPSPDAGRPTPVSPSGESINLKPFLVGGEARLYYSVDSITAREFEVDLIDGDFSVPVYSATENREDHQMTIELTPGVEYKWRIRDFINTGYITTWSPSIPFTVVAGEIEQPVVSAAVGLDATDMIARAGFESSTLVGGTHASSEWQVVDASGDVIHYVSGATDLTSTVVPFGVLKANSNYKVRVRYENTTGGVSAWSDWLDVKTELRFSSIELKPVVSFVGDDINATVAKPTFKSDSGIGEFWDVYMDRQGLVAEWEVVDSLDNVVWSVESVSVINEVQVYDILESGEVHRIRVRYYASDEFIAPSEWSEYVQFTPVWSIDAPVVSYTGDANAVDIDATFDSSTFVGTNDSFRFVKWEITDPLTGDVVYSGSTVESSWYVEFSADDSEKEYDVKIKHLGLYGESEWSLPLSIVVQKIVDIFVYSGGTDQTFKKIDPYGVEVFTIDPIEIAIYGISVDFDGNMFIATYDNTVVKYDKNQNRIWTYTGHTGQVRQTRIDSKGFIYSCSYDSTVRKIDPDGNEVWVFTGHTSSVTDLAIGIDDHIYSCSSDRSVKKIDPNGNEVWSFDAAVSLYSVDVDTLDNVYAGVADNYIKISNSCIELDRVSVIGAGNIWGISVTDSYVYIGAYDDYSVRKFDSLGNEIWKFTGHTGRVFQIDTDIEGNVYSGSNDNTVRKIDPDGNEVWVFTGHTSAVYAIATTQVPFLLPHVDLSVEFEELEAPTPLNAVTFSQVEANMTAPTVQGVTASNILDFSKPTNIEGTYDDSL